MKAFSVLAVAVLFSFATPLIGQKPPRRLWAACGDTQTQFSVHLARQQNSIAPSEPGKARVFFIEDLDTSGIARIGIGGHWVGALKRSSYFSVSVDPGERHLCAATNDGHVALAHFVAEEGKTYYYRVFVFYNRNDRVANLTLDPVDSDEAEFQIGFFRLATSHPTQ